MKQVIHGYPDIGIEYPLHVTLAAQDGYWSASFDAPGWGDESRPFTAVNISDDRLELSFVDIRKRRGEFSGQLVGDEIKGTYVWRAVRYPFVLRRAGPNWTQAWSVPDVPRPPFPYALKEVQFPSGGVQLTGALTIPSGPAPAPAVLLLDGGTAPWDAEIPGRPDASATRWIIADRLSRAGIAVLRLDSRGEGESGGSREDTPLADLAGDAAAAIRFLRGRPEIDPARIGLIGHSEGGVIASLAAVAARPVACVVLLAAPAVPLDEAWIDHFRWNSRGDRVSVGDMRPFDRAELSFETYAVATVKREDLTDAQVREAVLQYGQSLRDYNVGREVMDADVSRKLRPLFRSVIRCDPRPTLGKLDMPVLALMGGRDRYVPPDLHLSELKKCLRVDRRRDVTVKVFPGFGHSLRERADVAIDPEVLKLIVDWTKARLSG